MQPPENLIKAAAAIRLAFFDIDGTLLDSRGQILPDLYPALNLLKQRGIKTAIASGRPYFAAKFIIDELALNDTGMFYTGAHLFDPSNKKTLCDISLSTEAALTILDAANSLGIYTEVYSDDAFFVATITPVTKVHAAHLRVQPRVDNLTEVIQSRRITKLLLGVNRAERGDLLSLLERQFPQQIFARAYLSAYPDWQFASVIAGEATKVNAFELLLAHHQVNAHQVIAFGDAESDMDFLRMAGIGIAMGNANSQVQSAADWVTKTADNAGVAFAINQLFNSQP